MAISVEISLQLEPTEPVSGFVREADGPEQRFAGWLELNSMLERICDTARREEADQR